MSPLELEIAIHYYYSGEDFRGGDFDAPAVRSAIDRFKAEGLIKESHLNVHRTSAYQGTDRLNVFVEALLATPLPVWAMPTAKEPTP